MADKPKITHTDTIGIQKLLGDLVCRFTDPDRTGRVEDVHLGNECTVRWLDSDTLEKLARPLIPMPYPD